jgi:hypothetical protein
MNHNETTIINRDNRILSGRKQYSVFKKIFYLLSFFSLTGTLLLIFYGTDSQLARAGSGGIWGALIFLLFGLLCKARLDHISSIELYRRQNYA